jgi:low affinity Fe/Cu permease
MPTPSSRKTTPTASPLGENPPQVGLFQRTAASAIRFTGSRWAFLIALTLVITWALTGPYFRYSEMWQLVINTCTSIITFLMVFLIQNAQNRDSKAVNLKLDELIYSVNAANNALIDIESLTEEQLEQIAERYRKVAERHHKLLALEQSQAEAIIERKVDEKVTAKSAEICGGTNGHVKPAS